MSTIHIHVGQCGNQLGRDFWLKASALAEKDSNSKRVFYTLGGLGRDEGGHMRAVFIDSEKKVLQGLMRLTKAGKKYSVPSLKVGYGNAISSARSCGSNWPMGHNHMAREKVVNPWPTDAYTYTHEFDYGREDSMLKASMEAIRREVEACDCFSGFVLWHSLAGGTGSGFGARLSAEVRDRYPVAYQMSVTVAPLNCGENPTQSYNELLCLAGLQQDSDGIFIYENEEIMDVLHKRSSNSSVSFDSMNSYITDCMLNVLAPVSSLTPPSGVTVGIEPWELVRSVAPMSPLKLLHCRTVSEKLASRPVSAQGESWEALCNKLCQQSRSKFLHNKSPAVIGNSTLAAACVCRNTAKSKTTPAGNMKELDIAKLASKVKDAYNCVKWNPFPVDVWTDQQQSLKPGQRQSPKSITVCSNLTSLATVHCDNLLRSARIKFDAKAYLHWYKRYGTDESDFENAFETVQSIVDEYKKAAAP